MLPATQSSWGCHPACRTPDAGSHPTMTPANARGLGKGEFGSEEGAQEGNKVNFLFYWYATFEFLLEMLTGIKGNTMQQRAWRQKKQAELAAQKKQLLYLQETNNFVVTTNMLFKELVNLQWWVILDLKIGCYCFGRGAATNLESVKSTIRELDHARVPTL